MSFTTAALIVAAAGVVVLGMIAYHLLTRVHLLERAVQGGIEPPTRRLNRQEFERRFAIASERSLLAQRFESGLVIFLGPEATRDHPVVAALAELARPDGINVVMASPPDRIGTITPQSTDDAGLDLERLGVSTTPYAFALDDGRVRAARPIGGAVDLEDFVRDNT